MSIAAETTACGLDEPDLPSHAVISALHLEFHDRLVRLCTRQLRDPSLAEDVAQDTMLRALRFWASYDADRPTWPWLKTIALRLCVDAQRARSRELCLPEVPERPERADRTDAVLDEITLRRAMAGLPERQRLALRLRYLDDRDRVSSAQVLGLNVNAFDQLLSRARLRLATVIGPAALAGPLTLASALVRRLRARPLRRSRAGLGGAAAGSAAVLPLAVAPLVAIAVATVAAGSSPASTAYRLMPSSTTAAYVDTVAPRAVAHAPAGPVQPGGAAAASVAPNLTHVQAVAGPGAARAWVSGKPLRPGHIEQHRIVVSTPAGQLDAGGDTSRTPEASTLCTLPGVDCN